MSDWIRRHSAGLSQQALSEAIFSGRILYFEQLEPMGVVVAETQRLLRAAFDPHPPECAYGVLPPDEHEARFREAEQAFRSNATIKDYLYRALGAAGVHVSETFCDRLRVRASPPQQGNAGRPFFSSSTPGHRDSWGSAILCQINWWFPVFPLERDRTLAIYPAHWATGVDNNAQGWDWRRAGKDPNTPRAPGAVGHIDRSDEVRVVIAPGTLAAFSAAHLHAGVMNTTQLTRFSVETRTVNLDDLRAGRGAPNVDGMGSKLAYEWFSRMTDGRSLADVVTS
jgi:hypothetical protein